MSIRLSSLFASGRAVRPAIAAAACSGSEAVQSTPRVRAAAAAAESRGAGHHGASSSEKSIPLTLGVIGTVEAVFDRRRARADHRRADLGATSRKATTSRKGQVLFTLDRRPLEAALQQARGEPRSATWRRRPTRGRRRSATRISPQRGIATKEQVDRRAPRPRRSTPRVGADRAAVENAKVQLQYATITAPISGRTGALMVHAGNLVRANDTTPLVVINQVAPIYVVVRHSRGAACRS